MLTTTLAVGAAAATATMTGPRNAHAASDNRLGINAADLGLKPSGQSDQTGAFQNAIDHAAQKGVPLLIPPGTYLAKTLNLRAGSQIIGTPNLTNIIYIGSRAHFVAHKKDNITLEGLVLNGNIKPLDPAHGTDGLVSALECGNITLRSLKIEKSLINGISLRNCSGQISDLNISKCTNTGIFALDSDGLHIGHSEISDCANNGIQIWQSRQAEDGSTISNCRIKKIKARAGGSGQNGNGINIFRAGSVIVTNNHISDCAYSAIRGNSASNLIMTNNNCTRLGEVALYAEFSFEGVVIANNIVDRAATGISVTNFNQGGRLAIIQGNLIRNLKRRPRNKDKRGIGIAVEADAVVSGNIIENAETMGLAIGWGKHMRDISANGNLIRKSKIGIGISAEHDAGLVFVANNMISGASNGAIRAMLYDKPTGPDLVHSSAESFRNFALIGNVAT